MVYNNWSSFPGGACLLKDVGEGGGANNNSPGYLWSMWCPGFSFLKTVCDSCVCVKLTNCMRKSLEETVAMS